MEELEENSIGVILTELTIIYLTIIVRQLTEWQKTVYRLWLILWVKINKFTHYAGNVLIHFINLMFLPYNKQKNIWCTDNLLENDFRTRKSPAYIILFSNCYIIIKLSTGKLEPE